MDRFATSHFSNRALVLEVKRSDLGERVSTAVVLSRLAEFDDRRLFLQEGYPSMHAFLVRELQYTEERAAKRIYGARTARRFPVLLIAMAEGRLHLSGLVVLARYLTSANIDELLAAASRKTGAEIEQLIAERFPKPDLPQGLEPFAPPPPRAAAERGEHSPGNVDALLLPHAPGSTGEHSPGNARAALLPPAPAREDSPGNPPPAPWPRVKPLSPQR